MNEFILYLIESGICLLVFFTIYQVFMKQETYYQLNRVYLLASLVFSLVVPLLNVTLRTGSPGQTGNFQMEPLLVSATSGAIAATRQIGVFEILTVIYFLVALVLVTRLLFGFSRMKKLYKLGRIETLGDLTLVIHPGNYPPFSFFNRIFISKQQFSDETMDEIIEHEKAHVKQWHSMDLVIAEILKILQWFNPMAWYFKDMVTENHEFLADEAVLNRGFSPESYQLRILTQLFGIRSIPAVHNFNQSVTQKRLKMMEKSKSTAASRLKMLAALPAAILLFYMFGCASESSDPNGSNYPEAGLNKEVYYQVDQAAEPDGGVMAFRKDIAGRVIYPDGARKNGVQGRIFVRFIIDENGKLVKAVEDSKIPPPPPPPPPPAEGTEPEAESTPPPEKEAMEGIVVVGYRPVKGDENVYDPAHLQLLADEAVRVIMESEIGWKPAMKNGKAVPSAWTIPIQFSLQ
jgi:hypothetical protein